MFITRQSSALHVQWISSGIHARRQLDRRIGQFKRACDARHREEVGGQSGMKFLVSGASSARSRPCGKRVWRSPRPSDSLSGQNRTLRFAKTRVSRKRFLLAGSAGKNQRGGARVPGWGKEKPGGKVRNNSDKKGCV